MGGKALLHQEQDFLKVSGMHLLKGRIRVQTMDIGDHRMSEDRSVESGCISDRRY